MSNKKLPENATKTEGAELARRGRGEISTATAVPHVNYDDLRHADRITVDCHDHAIAAVIRELDAELGV